MEGEIESEPSVLKNLPAIVNRQLVKVSFLYSREYSRGKRTKSWEENGDFSTLHTTINGLLSNLQKEKTEARILKLKLRIWILLCLK